MEPAITDTRKLAPFASLARIITEYTAGAANAQNACDVSGVLMTGYDASDGSWLTSVEGQITTRGIHMWHQVPWVHIRMSGLVSGFAPFGSWYSLVLSMHVTKHKQMSAVVRVYTVQPDLSVAHKCILHQAEALSPPSSVKLHLEGEVSSQNNKKCCT